MSANMASDLEWSYPEFQEVVYGGANNRWGLSFITPTDVTSPSFALHVRCYRDSTGSAAVRFHIRNVSVKIHFTLPPTTTPSTTTTTTTTTSATTSSTSSTGSTAPTTSISTTSTSTSATTSMTSTSTSSFPTAATFTATTAGTSSTLTVDTSTSGVDSSAADSTTSNTERDTSTSVEENSSSDGAVMIGIVVIAALVTVAIIVGLVLLVVLLLRRKNETLDPLQAAVELESLAMSDIQVKERLGGGHFVEVYRGVWLTSDVALKRLKSAEAQTDFWREAALLKSLNHPNIAADGAKYIVMEFMTLGSLDIVLRSKKLTVAELCQLATQAAAGMLYLSQKQIVHRDLALRNEQFVVKVSDFGLSRASDNGYYKTSDTTMPIKWCAPEILKYQVFTVQSDVYAFGVVLWEIFSFGQVPWTMYSNKEAAQAVLSGETLTPPKDCPDEVCSIMKSCWSVEPHDRPSFSQLHEALSKLSASERTLNYAASLTPKHSQFYN